MAILLDIKRTENTICSGNPPRMHETIKSDIYVMPAKGGRWSARIAAVSNGLHAIDAEPIEFSLIKNPISSRPTGSVSAAGRTTRRESWAGSKLAAAAFILMMNPALGLAQEGCKTTAASCTKMSQDCERLCQNGNNPGRCIGSLCVPKLASCQSTGVWKSSSTAAACWKTSNRS